MCCYPDYGPLLAAAAARARRLLVFSHPPSHVVSTAVIAAQNGVFALLGKEYRAFAHAEAAMYGVVVDQGLRQLMADRGAIWHLAAFERVDPVQGPP